MMYVNVCVYIVHTHNSFYYHNFKKINNYIIIHLLSAVSWMTGGLLQQNHSPSSLNVLTTSFKRLLCLAAEKHTIRFLSSAITYKTSVSLHVASFNQDIGNQFTNPNRLSSQLSHHRHSTWTYVCETKKFLPMNKYDPLYNCVNINVV